MASFVFCFLLMIIHVCSGQKPKLSEINHNRSQNIGTRFIILCSVEEGVEPFRFVWKHNDQTLVNNDDDKLGHHHIETAQERSMFTINKLNVNDSGNYTCAVSNYFGQDFQNIFLIVKGLIFFNFSINMWRISLVFFSNIHFIFINSVLLKLQFGSKNLNMKMFHFIFIISFQCFILVYSSFPPKLDPFPRQKFQDVGTSFKLLCGIQQGTKPLFFKWFKNDHLLNDRQLNYKIDFNEEFSVLNIQNLTKNNSGNYSCSVSNSFGNDIQYTLLSVKGLIFLGNNLFFLIFLSIRGASYFVKLVIIW